jgi:CheY-like chemotaxis protein
MSKVTILVVDDDVQIRRTLRATLVSNGYDVIEARDGHEAIEAVLRERPSLPPDMTIPPEVVLTERSHGSCVPAGQFRTCRSYSLRRLPCSSDLSLRRCGQCLEASLPPDMVIPPEAVSFFYLPTHQAIRS